ncbi:MAG TPA: hypothetical protein PLV42_11775 [bacterium]|nr:hypothetical protein [bacterium]
MREQVLILSGLLLLLVACGEQDAGSDSFTPYSCPNPDSNEITPDDGLEGIDRTPEPDEIEEPDDPITDTCPPEIKKLAKKMPDAQEWVYHHDWNNSDIVLTLSYDIDGEGRCIFDVRFCCDADSGGVTIVPADSHPVFGTPENGGCDQGSCFTYTYQPETDTLLRDHRYEGQTYSRIFNRRTAD